MALAQTQREPEGDDKPNKEGSDDAAFLKECVKRFNRAEAREAAMRQEALDDLRFFNGDHWPQAIRAQRTIDKRPCLTINKLPTFVHQICNDQRQNRPSINVSPVGDKADVEVAKMMKGLIRQIERASRADIAYDTGYFNAVTMGWGYWRIRTDYEDEDTFDQVIKIERISNPFTVYVDPASKMPDASDAQWVFISQMMPRAEFDDSFPEANAYPWEEGSTGDEYKTWSTQTEVRIAEYFYKDIETRKLVKLVNGHVGYEDELDESLKAQIKADPDFVLEEREAQCPKIRWCKLTSHEVLEREDWAGKYIPVVRVIGDEVDIEGKVNYFGMVRLAKDAQRMYDFWATAETELVALAPKAPWVMEEGQIEGHEQRWQQANNKSLPYLLYKGTSVSGKPAPPPQRQQFAGPPAAVIQAKMAAAQDMQAVTGLRFDATLQERMYDESGKALRELKRVSDLGSFHYIDNLSRSLRFTGLQLIDLIPKIYDTPRIITILREDDSEERVKIDPQLPTGHKDEMVHGYTGATKQRVFNPRMGDYEVAVTIGPSFATKRAEAADSMLNFIKFYPQSGPMVADLVAKNMDWPGAEEIAARLQAMLPPQLLAKNLDRLPPDARGLVMNLQHQLQQLQQQHQQAVAMLGDKERDRALVKEGLQNEREKISADVQTKLAKIQEDLQKAMLQIQADLNQKRGDDGEAKLLAKLEEIDANLHAKLADIEAKSEAHAFKTLVDAKTKRDIAQMQAKQAGQQKRN